MHFDVSDLLAFFPHPSSFKGTNCLRTLHLLYWLVLLPPSSKFLSLSCLSVFAVLDLLPIEKESLIEKVSFEKVLHNHLLNPGYSDPWLVFFQVFEKCFSLPAVGTFGTLFEENNLFISG